MALNWSIENTDALSRLNALSDKLGDDPERTDANHAEFDEMVTLRRQRDAIVWATLITGFPADSWGITEDNVDEMRMRLCTYWKLTGETHDWLPTSRDDLAPFIGLSTNAGTKTDREFWAWVRRYQRTQYGL